MRNLGIRNLGLYLHLLGKPGKPGADDLRVDGCGLRGRWCVAENAAAKLIRVMGDGQLGLVPVGQLFVRSGRATAPIRPVSFTGGAEVYQVIDASEQRSGRGRFLKVSLKSTRQSADLFCPYFLMIMMTWIGCVKNCLLN